MELFIWFYYVLGSNKMTKKTKTKTKEKHNNTRTNKEYYTG